MDFTIKKYSRLLRSLQQNGYEFITFEDYCLGVRMNRFVILRHDVDEMAHNALEIAEVENKLGIISTFFFRIVKHSNHPEIIRKIVSLGHQIGYHYEDLAMANGDKELAYTNFQKNLKYFRSFAPVATICMHGSSMSEFDNRLLWQTYDYKNDGIIGEPYFSVNFNEVFYLTDTGYCWDGYKTAVRDTAPNKFNLSFHTTDDIIEAINQGLLPNQVMILAHTLWTDNLLKWLFIYVREKSRNSVKRASKNSKFIKNIYSKLVKFYWKK